MEQFVQIFQTVANNSHFSVDTVFGAIVIFILVRIISILEGYVKKFFDKNEHRKGIIQRERADNVIYHIISTTLSVLGGERIQVFEFHNGTRTIAMIPWTYMSCSYEAVQLGAPPKAELFQRILTTLYSSFLRKVALNSMLALNVNNKDETLPENTYELMNLRGALKSLYIKMVDPKTQEVIGFIAYDNNTDGFSENAITTIRKIASQIALTLTLSTWDEAGEFVRKFNSTKTEDKKK